MKTILPICLLFVTLGLFSCKKDEGKATDAITAIRHAADHGEITFEWQQPVDENFFYTDIRYTVDGVEYSKKVSKYRDSTTIEGLTSNEPIDFQFYAVSNDGKYSPVTLYPAAPLTPPFADVATSVEISSKLNGEDLFNEVILSWVNETGKRVTIEVAYINSAGQLASSSFTATATGSSALGNLAGGPGRTFTVVVKDAKQNSSDARNFTVDVLNTIQMDKSGWSFPGYDATSRYETIGYSSQALNEANATYPNNGSVLAMIDGAIDSFWHASWSNPNTAYPHWFIIDFGVEVTITHVEMARRQGNSGTHKGFQVLTCTDAGAMNLADPTTWSWQDQGEYVFDPTINALQRYRIATRPRVRYIQMYMDAKFKGTGNYVMISEFNAFALDE
jgi:hypothetical protein